MHYTTSDLQRLFSSRYLARGQQYRNADRVHYLAITENDTRITARVRGSRPEPYGVSIRIRNNRQNVAIQGACTCPIGHNCKHVAAVLLQALEEKKAGTSATEQPLSPLPSSPPKPDISPALTRWFKRVTEAGEIATSGDYSPAVRDRVLYLLGFDSQDARLPRVRIVSVRLRKEGGYSQARDFEARKVLSGYTPKYVTVEDVALVKELLVRRTSADRGRLQEMEGAMLLERMLHTGRCHWDSPDSPPLSIGESREVHLDWSTDTHGSTRLSLTAEPPATGIFITRPLWYVDAEQGVAGQARIDVPLPLAMELTASPTLGAEELARVGAWLQEHVPSARIPPPPELSVEEHRDLEPCPVLNLYTRHLYHGFEPYPVDAARLSFEYQGESVGLDDETAYFSRYRGGRIRRLYRNPETEIACLRRLGEWGFKRLSEVYDSRLLFQQMSRDLGLPNEAAWSGFMLEGVSRLRTQGWTIRVEEGFRYNLVAAREWYAELDERSGIDWFGLALGVEIDGKPVNLLPMLVKFLRAQPPERSIRDWLNGLTDDERFSLPLGDGRLLSIPASRVRAILEVLIELYDEPDLDDQGELSLPRIQAGRLAELEAALQGAPLRWQGGDALRDLAHRLREAKVPERVELPLGLRAELRPYQQSGLVWLQFLREHEVGGILADDMGLGKTVQTLAHLLLEKEAGRLDRPSLVVAPTSLMTNWRLETVRFAPALRVLTLHGPGRHGRFQAIAEHDVVLTTYALLPRDQQALQAHAYHLLILDESQAIKNPKAQAGQVVRKLDVRHRLCLTGTPMENHLGELWSLFDFLMPGLLGHEGQFRRLFRRPIEQFGDTERRARLVRRIAPFTLRRTKEQVAGELPAKTEIVRTVELHDDQRDLYESIRVAMQNKVRQAIQNKGLARSHIVILDALLKLRQVCCDPRLLKLESARKFTVKRSAKLVLLLELLDNLLEEGRRVLLFSQFTSMLELIEAELNRRNAAYVKLTGQTRDRATPVERFQAGEVPLFLISLKAGGTGLNLTAADIVIHYDPWWNPAVEDQATDRAHRIGQDKPVFVYKLFTEGTVEEKIRELQTRKRALTEGVLEAEGDGKVQWTNQDLDFLFAPLE